MLRLAASVPVAGQVIPLNAGDVERALAYWAADASVKFVGVPTGIKDSFCGKEQVRAWFQCLVALHFQCQVKVIKLRGDIVTTRTESMSDLTRESGIRALITTETYVVGDGQIAGLTLVIPPQSRLALESALGTDHGGGGPVPEDLSTSSKAALKAQSPSHP